MSETAPEANGIRCIRFHPEGEAIFSGAQDSLRVREEEGRSRGEKRGRGGGEIRKRKKGRGGGETASVL